uniref:Uncharacterized protein n=1 Tax=Solanum tuberosum TaxID=4113 RepID=M1DQE0_SOLTU
MEPKPKQLAYRNVVPDQIVMPKRGNRSHNYAETWQSIQVSYAGTWQPIHSTLHNHSHNERRKAVRASSNQAAAEADEEGGDDGAREGARPSPHYPEPVWSWTWLPFRGGWDARFLILLWSHLVPPDREIPRLEPEDYTEIPMLNEVWAGMIPMRTSTLMLTPPSPRVLDLEFPLALGFNTFGQYFVFPFRFPYGFLLEKHGRRAKVLPSLIPLWREKTRYSGLSMVGIIPPQRPRWNQNPGQ